MSFGYSVGDAVLLLQLAWKTLQSTIKACGEHDELTREVSSLHRVLKRLHRELKNPESLLNRPDDDRKQELREIADGCSAILNVMNSILDKYNALPEEKRSARKLWQRIKFGNGEMQDLSEIRLKLSTHTSAILMMVNLCSLGSQGRVETQLSHVGGELEGIRGKVDWIAANMTARSGDGTIWTSYANDDKALWKELRSELNKEGYDSSVLRKHRRLIKNYVQELGDRGLFDQPESEDEKEEEDMAEDLVEEKNDEIEKKIDSARGELERDNDKNTQDQSQVDELELSDLALGTESGITAEGIQSENSSLSSQPLEIGNLTRNASMPSTSVGSLNFESSDASNGLLTETQHLISADQIPKAVQIQDVPDEHFDPDEPKNFASEWLLDEVPIIQDAKKSDNRRSNNLASGVIFSNFPDQNSGELAQSSDLSGYRSSSDLPSSVLDTNSIPNAVTEATRQQEEIAIENGQNSEQTFTLPEHNQLPRNDKVEIIKFKDAVGRKFTFPFRLIRTWAGMEESVKQAFLHVEIIGPHVAEGHYDLIGPNGEIILPQHWEELIQPDMAISMYMWPRPEPTPPPRHGSTSHRSGLPPLPPASHRGPPPPPPPGWRAPSWPIAPSSGVNPSGGPAVITIDKPTSNKQKSAPSNEGFMNWLAGEPSKQSANSKQKPEPLPKGEMLRWMAGEPSKQSAISKQKPEPLPKGEMLRWMAGEPSKQPAISKQKPGVLDWMAGKPAKSSSKRPKKS